ncbi:hypothetical protein HK096_010099 [Nowakowskiella sp. JEL0078]|nr:hypothetical protein HK096_010099 [Nowakowskiella sp. JEL0078]
MLDSIRRNSKSSIAPLATSKLPATSLPPQSPQPWLGRLKNVNPATGALISVTYSETSNSWCANYLLGRKDTINVSYPLHKLPPAHVFFLYHNAPKFIQSKTQNVAELKSVLSDVAASRGFAIADSSTPNTPTAVQMSELSVETEVENFASNRPLTSLIIKSQNNNIYGRRNSRTANILGDSTHCSNMQMQMAHATKNHNRMQQIIDSWRCNTAFKGRICYKCGTNFSRAHIHNCQLLDAHLAIREETWERFHKDRSEVPNEFVRSQFSLMDSLLNHSDLKVFDMLFSYLDFVLEKPKTA